MMNTKCLLFSWVSIFALFFTLSFGVIFNNSEPHFKDAFGKSPFRSSSIRGSIRPTDSVIVKSHIKQSNCALLFFGLIKRFELVLPSINQYIVENNPNCDIYAHTYKIRQTSNPRNNETDAEIRPEDLFLLTPNVVMDTDTEFLRSRNISYYRTFFPDDAGWDYPTSIDNMVKQWHSIERAWGVMQASEIASNTMYSRVGLFRLDVFYTNEIDLLDGDAVVPDWHSFGGINDRVFYGSRFNANIWATHRFRKLPDYVTETGIKGIKSEKFMKFLMRDVPLTRKRICFRRVRANGDIRFEREDGVDLCAPWNKGIPGVP
mmetsp:Transcript_26552/g.50286  ORF Transcript_26552/g.50286 Transcript_26552/m.50286 type:complete len:318 (+) Transcript_26552:867-1820(+)